ncbi:MAG: glycoside hydrolase family 15 protein, partial [Acidobacteria bacterium]|nr:glycoside hydrolase family 15 protein [Acidobacteriota bacterium]
MAHVRSRRMKLDHGAIGNGRVIALVGPDTSIDWLCFPRFDSPSIFARLLDEERGGSFAFEPIDFVSSRMTYVRNTNVLRTEVQTADGLYEVLDFAPRLPSGLSVDAPAEIHRLVRPLDGVPRLRVRFDPRPDYARGEPYIIPDAQGIEIQGRNMRAFLRTNVPPPYFAHAQPVRVDRPLFFVLSSGRPTIYESSSAVASALDTTIKGWRAWARTTGLPSFAPDAVLRSALCLKLHAYNDTGAIIAAATTSIPEALGTERTWDYRFCWLRDAAFVVEALRRLTHLAEGEAFVRFLRDVADAGPLQPLYGIGGERELVETHLDHLAGFEGTRPVRIGNAAYTQVQNDLMGEMVLCLETLLTDPRVVHEDPTIIGIIERLVDEAIAKYDELDTGLWEYRTMPRHYTFSKAMSWVAANRGAELAALFGRPERATEWARWAQEKRDHILTDAYNTELGYFTQALQGRHPDASNLLLPTLGLLDPRDPRFISTVRAYESRLVDRGLMLRYRHDDDFGHTSSSFTICSFWWVEALAMMGELDEARARFEQLLSYANPLGLFSEDIEPSTGRLLGNFPQAYTHVGLIHAAITIGELSDARSGHFRA